MFLENSDKPNPLFTSWQQQDQSIMSVLISSLTKNIIAHILDAATSQEIWLVLEDLFLAKSQAHLMNVHY